jgi:hypothetical protein
MFLEGANIGKVWAWPREGGFFRKPAASSYVIMTSML